MAISRSRQDVGSEGTSRVTAVATTGDDKRERLLAAAREVFRDQGLDATLNDVARRAGMGVGTAYRRFANKQELIEAMLIGQVDDLEAILQSALGEPDAWTGIVSYLESSLAVQAGDRTIAEILAGRRVTRERHDWQRDRLAPLVDALVERAVAQGVVRPDLAGTDLIFLQLGITAIATATRQNPHPVSEDVSDLYRRYLWIALDGIRANVTHSALPVGPLSTHDTHEQLAPPASAPAGHP